MTASPLSRALLLALVSTSVAAQDGTPDTSFAANGRIAVAFDALPASPIDTVLDAVVDASGRVLLVGVVTTADGARIGIARLRADGALDLTYGPDNTGRVIAPPQMGFTLTGAAAALDANGNLLVGGTLSTNGNDDFAVCRFNTDGALSAFGNGFQCLKVAFDLGGGNDDVLHDLVIGTDGRVLLGGSVTQSNEKILAGVARLKANGDPDPTFNGTGKLSFAGNYGFDRVVITAMALQENGKLLAVGWGDETFDDPSSVPFAARILASGMLDDELSLNGVQISLPLSDARDAEFEALSLRPPATPLDDQGFVAAGRIETAPGSGLYAGLLVQRQGNGNGVPGFGDMSMVVDTIGHSLAYSDVEREADGAIIATGTVRATANNLSGLDFYATRYRADGTRDVFGFNFPFGYQTVDFVYPGANDVANAAVFQRDRLLLAGGSLRNTTQPPDLDFTVAALQRRGVFRDGFE